MTLIPTGWNTSQKITPIVFNTELKVLELFAGVSKWSSGLSHRRGGPLHSPLGRVRWGQGLLPPLWASKSPDWGLFSAQASNKPLLVKLWRKLARLPEVGRSPWFSSLLQHLLQQFLQMPFVAAETSLGWLEECDCDTWLSSTHLH